MFLRVPVHCTYSNGIYSNGDTNTYWYNYRCDRKEIIRKMLHGSQRDLELGVGAKAAKTEPQKVRAEPYFNRAEAKKYLSRATKFSLYFHQFSKCNTTHTLHWRRRRGRGRGPPIIREKIFFSQLLCKIRAFFRVKKIM